MSANIVKTSLGVTLVLFLGYAVSFVKESVIANYFGAGAAVDAYTVAIQIPVVLFAFVAVALRSVVLPLYTDLKINQGEDIGRDYINNLLTSLVLISILFVLLIILCAKYVVMIFAPGFSPEVNAESAFLLRILCPTVITTMVTNIWISVLNVHGKFIAPSLAVLALNTVLIISVLCLHSYFGIAAAAIGQLLGCTVEIGLMYILVHKHLPFRPIIGFRNQHVIKSLKMAIPVIWSTSLAEFVAMVNRIVASYLFVGSIAVLNYASKINSVFMSLFTAAIATIIYPMYAEAAARKDIQGLNSRVNKTLSVYVMFLAPITCLILGLKREIIEVAFERGAFGPEDVDRTQVLLGWLSIGLIFMGFRESLTKVFYSLKDTKTPAKNASIGLCINLALACSLPFFLGVQGLAITTAVTAVFISMGLLYRLHKLHKGVKMNELTANVVRIIPCSLIALSALFTIHQLTDSLPPIVVLLVCGSAFALIYIICLSLFNVPVWGAFLSSIKAKR